MQRAIQLPAEDGMVKKAIEKVYENGVFLTVYTFDRTDNLTRYGNRRVRLTTGDEPAYIFYAAFSKTKVQFKNFKPFDYTDEATRNEVLFQLSKRSANNRRYWLSTEPSDYALTKRRGVVFRRTSGDIVERPEWMYGFLANANQAQIISAI